MSFPTGFVRWRHSFTGTDSETGLKKSFFIEFYLCNPSLGKDRPVFGHSSSSGRDFQKPSYLMVKAGAWGDDACQIHRFYGIRKVEIETGEAFSISAGECFLSNDATKGYVCVSEEEAKSRREIVSDAGEMSWSLVMENNAVGGRTEYIGEVIWNGRPYSVSSKDSFGQSGIRWGSSFRKPWVQLFSGNIVSRINGRRLPGSSMDICSRSPQCRKFNKSQRIVSALRYEGKPYCFNSSAFPLFLRTSSSFRETRHLLVFHIEHKTLSDRIVVDITCRKKEMLLLRYGYPDGRRPFRRFWSGNAGDGVVKLYHHGRLIDEMKVKNVACEWGN